VNDRLDHQAGDEVLQVVAATTSADVVLFASGASDPAGLGQHLDLVVRRGSGGGFGTCAGFTAAATVYTGTVADFVQTHDEWLSGIGGWTAAGHQRATYRFGYTLQPETPSHLQATRTSATFQWEARLGTIS